VSKKALKYVINSVHYQLWSLYNSMYMSVLLYTVKSTALTKHIISLFT